MPIELAVTPQRQTTPMSCWWVCMSMVLSYYGQRYRYPWDFRPEFHRPLGRVSSPVMPDVRSPTIDEAMSYDATLRHSGDLAFLQPYEWFDHGLPRNSTKGFSHGCIEVETSFFTRLKKYASSGHAGTSLTLEVKYAHTSTYGGTRAIP